MKYIVMECHPGYAVVLADDGRFLKVANLHYQVGQTVTEIIEMRQPETQPVGKSRKKWLTSFAAFAACLVLVVSSILVSGRMTYASVYMRINPEVRIDVNRRDVVVGVEGVNADGVDLLEGYEYKRKDLDLVMDELVDRAIDMGYLHEGGTITLCLDADDEWVVSHGDHLSDQLSDYLTDKILVSIDIETKQSGQTSPGDTVVIPVDPDAYGDSDYDDNDDDDDADTGDSCYGDSADNGNSAYDDADDDDGQTDYGTASADDDDDDSDYDD